MITDLLLDGEWLHEFVPLVRRRISGPLNHTNQPPATQREHNKNTNVVPAGAGTRTAAARGGFVRIDSFWSSLARARMARRSLRTLGNRFGIGRHTAPAAAGWAFLLG